MRVVLAEDQALLREGLIRLLESHGFEIVAAAEDAGSLAEALADPDTADVALLDVRLPPTGTDEGLLPGTGPLAVRREDLRAGAAGRW